MRRRGILLFAGLGIAWGIPYLLIKIAVQEVDPAVVVLGRSAIGALVLLPVVVARRQVLPVLRRWRPLLAYTAAEIVVPWFFLTSAEQRLPSSLAGLLLAAVPLVGVAVAALSGRPEVMSRVNWLGVLAGMLGVAALVGLDVGGSDVLGLLQMVIVVVGYAIGPVILARRMSDLPGTGVVALSLAITALVYVPLVPLLGSWPTAIPSGAAIASIVTLGVVCSAVGFLLMFALIAEVGPVRVTMITYVNPAVAVAAGALVLHEQVTVWTLVGFVLVLTGSYLVSRRRQVAQVAAT
ncbi:DMT family transporter [Amnibacterium kyonggiense]|uniref:Threonine/homoserine efflux transporter RhtA n=1 Tax=Amnibacterium kyonggiense TaxID=595671 RepID=A0A4R7FPV0_9MICO|nr:DMT family transporter [Amnibacterium kyonggiense]TDS79797.1 threonine/homoserine efflux transporter RhtA [Amnibacterium kyonggiense]